jgi:hypothetical protein
MNEGEERSQPPDQVDLRNNGVEIDLSSHPENSGLQLVDARRLD